jgi:hypothetical protein
MIAYIDEHAWNRGLAQIPNALKEKRIAELEAHSETLGITCLSSSPGVLHVSLQNLPSPASFFEWCDFAHIACVDIEPADVLPLCGHRRNLDVLLTKRALETGAAVLYHLEPHQVAEELRNLGAELATASSDGAGDLLSETQATDDLVNAGLLPKHAQQELINRINGVSDGRDEFGAFTYTGDRAGKGNPIPSEFESDPSESENFF